MATQQAKLLQLNKQNKMQMQNKTLVRASGKQQEGCSCQAGAVQKGRGACLCAALGQLGSFPF